MNARSRLPLVPIALAAAVALAGCSQAGSDTSAAPLSAEDPTSASAPTVAPPSVASPAAKPAATQAAGTARPAASATGVPTASARVTGAPETAETTNGVVYGLIRTAGDNSFTYDKVDYTPGPCAAVEGDGNLRPEIKTPACFRNVNPRIRTVQMDLAVEIFVRNEGNPPEFFTAPELRRVITDEVANDTPVEYRVWEITLVDGSARRIDQFPVAGA